MASIGERSEDWNCLFIPREGWRHGQEKSSRIVGGCAGESGSAANVWSLWRLAEWDYGRDSGKEKDSVDSRRVRLTYLSRT